MHAVVAEQAETAATVINGAAKTTKKRGKNNRKCNQKSITEGIPQPVQENINLKNKTLNSCKKNGSVEPVTNGRSAEDSLSVEKFHDECVAPVQNGFSKCDHPEEENGETNVTSSSRKSRSKNKKKHQQKGARNGVENGMAKKDDKEHSSVTKDSDTVVVNNHNSIDKKLLNGKDSPIENGTNCTVASDDKAVKTSLTMSLSDSATPPAQEKQKIKPQQNLSSRVGSESSKALVDLLAAIPGSTSAVAGTSYALPGPSSLAIARSLYDLPGPSSATAGPSYELPGPSRTSPGPSTSMSSASSISNHSSSSSSAESQGLDLVKTSTAEPTEEEGAVGGMDPSKTIIEYKQYESELQMQDIMRLIQSELSEPYSIYTYRYFIYNWPKLCFLAAHGEEYVGAIVCKLDMHMNVKRGYIAMLAVKKEYRKMKIGTTLVEKAIEAMLADGADEVVLETEMKNTPALRLYENLGFVRDKRLFRYYLNGVDALRLKLWFR